MQILKTTLIEFDEARERARIESNYEPRVRDKLLAVLDPFVKGDWAAALAAARGMPTGYVEFFHPVVFDITFAYHHQRAAVPASPYPKFERA
jgi:hypothetical protein